MTIFGFILIQTRTATLDSFCLPDAEASTSGQPGPLLEAGRGCALVPCHKSDFSTGDSPQLSASHVD